MQFFESFVLVLGLNYSFSGIDLVSPWVVSILEQSNLVLVCG